MGASSDRVLRVVIVGNASSAEASVEGLGRKMKAFALVGVAAAAAVAGKSVEMASKYQSSMKLIQTQAGASAGEVKRMSAAVLTLAGKTATAPIELSDSLFHIESTGQRGAKALNELRIAAEGAKTGQADLTDVTNALNATLVSKIPGVKNMAGAMGKLNAIVGAGDMHMQDLADAMGTGMLAVVKGFGVNLNQVGGALATFGDNNIRGAAAATGLRMAVQAIAKPVSGGAAALKALGLSTTDLAGAMTKHGLTGALTMLHDKLVTAGDTGKKMGQVLTDAFGKKAGTGLNVLESQYSRYIKKTKDVSEGSKKFGKDFAATQQTLSYKVDQMKASLDALAIKLGDKLIPVVTQVVGFITNKVVPALSTFGNWLKQNATWVVPLVEALGTFVAIVYTIIKVIKVWTAVQAAFDIVMDANPIMLVVAALVALGVGLVEAYKHCQTFRNIVNDVFNFIKQHWVLIGTILVGPIFLAVTEIVKHWDTIKQTFESAYSWVKGFLDTHWQLILGILTGPFVLGVVEIIKHWGQITAFFTAIPGEIKGFFSTILTDFENIGKNIIQGLLNGLVNNAHLVYDEMSKIASSIKDKITHPWRVFSPSKTAEEIGMFIMVGLANGLAKNASKPVRAAYDAALAIEKAVVKAANSAVNSGAMALAAKSATAILSSVGTVIAKLKDVISADSGAKSSDPFIRSIRDRIVAIQQMQSAVSVLTSRLSKSNAALKSTQSAAKQFRQGVSSSLKSGFDLSSLADSSSGTGILTSLKAQSGPLRQLLADIKKLAKLHLNGSMLAQIANAGPVQGDAWAQALLADPGDIGSINSTQAALNKVANATGAATSDALYGKQIAAERKEVHAQTEQLKHANELLQRIADQAVHQINIEVNGKTSDAKALAKEIAVEVRRELIAIKRRNAGKSGV